MSEEKFREAPFLSNVGLMLTYKCTIACPHCIVEAGPKRTEEMSLRSAFNWIDQLSRSSEGKVLGISLTGGEPFYNISNLRKISDYANKWGFFVSAVTNAYWASTKEEALHIMELCSSIKMISVSTDGSHQKNIPFENVRNAIWAAKKTGKLYNISVATESESLPEYAELIDKILEITDKENINTAYIIPVGRAARNAKSQKYENTADPPATACPMANFPIIFPNGNVVACIGPPIILPEYNPLFLGNLENETIDEIFKRAEKNYVLHSIRTFGPKILTDLIRDHGREDMLPGNYIKDAICDVCYKLLSKKDVCDLLDKLIADDETFRLKTAFGRYYYLEEEIMLNEDFADRKLICQKENEFN